MPPAHSPADATASGDPPALSTLLRFAPYLWPRHSRAQRMRIVLAGVCVLLSILIQLSMGYWFGAIINRMQPGMQPGVLIAVACVDGHGDPLVPCGRCRQLLHDRIAPYEA